MGGFPRREGGLHVIIKVGGEGGLHVIRYQSWWGRWLTCTSNYQSLWGRWLTCNYQSWCGRWLHVIIKVGGEGGLHVIIKVGGEGGPGHGEPHPGQQALARLTKLAQERDQGVLQPT